MKQSFSSSVPYQVEGIALLIPNNLPTWMHFPTWRKDQKFLGTLVFCLCVDLPVCVKCQEPALLNFVATCLLIPKFGEDQVALMVAQVPTSFLAVSASGKSQCRHALDSAMRTSWADAQWQTLAPFFKAIPDVFPSLF